MTDDSEQELDRPEETESAEAPQEQLDPERWVDRAAIAGAAVVLLIALAPAWLSRQMPVRGDALTYFWPLRKVLAAAQSEGTLPYFSTLNDGGTPLWRNPQSQSLYPPALLLSWLPAAEAMNAYFGTKLREFRGNDDGFPEIEIWNVFRPVFRPLAFPVDDNLAQDG